MSTSTGAVPPSSGSPSFSLRPISFHPRRTVDLSVIDLVVLQQENEKIVHEVKLLSGQVTSVSGSLEEASREIKAVQHKIEGVAGKTFDNTQTILRNQKESHQKLDTAREEVSSVNKGLAHVLQRQDSFESTLSQFEDTLSKLVDSNNGLVEAFKSSQEHQKNTDEKLNQILAALQSR